MYGYLELEQISSCLGNVENREPEVDSDEVLEKQNSVINGVVSHLSLSCLLSL